MSDFGENQYKVSAHIERCQTKLLYMFVTLSGRDVSVFYKDSVRTAQ